MLLTLTTTHKPATDLGYLLHKSPFRAQSAELSFGQAHVFYPEATAERCTAALMLEINPVDLVRGRKRPSGDGGLLDQYVNDRPYVANSFLSVAIGRIFTSALGGRSKDRPELVEERIALSAKLIALPCRGGEGLLHRLFEPLGYTVSATGYALDEKFPEWGPSPYFTVELTAETRLQDLLTHLYVLIPVLDNEKHYWVGEDEIDKLLKHGEGWLPQHPEKELIVSRYLKRQSNLAREALSRLVEEDSPDAEEVVEQHDREEQKVETPLNLNKQRTNAVLAAVKQTGAKRVVDLGCGEGNLLKLLLADSSFESILGMDVSYRSLEIAQERLKMGMLPTKQRERIQLIQGSLMYRDERLHGFDVATVVEVIEHLDAPRLAAFERVLFEFARPQSAVVTTPNVEYNVLFETLPVGQFRHRDHRFEWTRSEFQDWAHRIATRFGYDVRFLSIGEEDSQCGSPTQMAIFSRTQSKLQKSEQSNQTI